MDDTTPQITLPDVIVTPDEAPPPISDHFNLAVGGGMDLAAMAPAIAPLDQMTADRVSGHANIDAPAPDVLSGDYPTPQPLELSPDLRNEYNYSLMNGEVDGPRDFAERAAGVAWSVAGEAAARDAVDPVGDNTPAQVTNAAKAIEASLPSHQDLIDYGIALSNQVFGTATPTTVAVIKQNLLDQWSQTGTPVGDLAKAGLNDGASALALATPPQQWPVLPPEEVQRLTEIDQPLGHPGLSAEGIVNSIKTLAYLPGEEYDRTKEIQDMQTAVNADGTPKFSDHDILAAQMDRPTVKLLASMIAGKAFGTGADILADSKTAATIKDLMTDESGQLKPERAEMAGELSVAALTRYAIKHGELKASFDDILAQTEKGGPLDEVLRATEARAPQSVLDKAIEITEQRQAMAGAIREAVGESTYTKALAKQTLDGFFAAVNKMVPGYLNWVNDFQGKLQDYARAKEAWTSAGNAPEDFKGINPRTLVDDYHPMQTLYDHIENRPGGGRLAPDDPLFPMATQIRSLLDERKQMIQDHVSDTMGFWEDYFPHDWLNPRAQVKAVFSEAYANGGSAYHLGERNLPTIFDGIVRGLTPRFPNPIEGTLHYIQGMDDLIAAQKVRDWLTGQGHAYYDTRPRNSLDVPLKGRAATQKGKIIIDNGQVVATAPDKQLYAPKGYATIYNRWVGRGTAGWTSDFGRAVNSLYNKILMAKNATLGLAFGLSGFHPIVIAKQTTASALGRSMGNISHAEFARALGNAGLGAFTPVEVAMQLHKGARFQNVYMGTAPNATDTEKKLKSIYIRSGGAAPTEGRGEPYWASSSRSLFKEWERAGAWGAQKEAKKLDRRVQKAVMAPLAIPATAVKSTVRDVIAAVKGRPGEGPVLHTLLPIPRIVGAIAENFGRVADTLMGPLFDTVIPKIKMAAWADEMEDWIRRNPLAEDAAVLRQGRQLMDSMDDRFGEMNMRNVFWSPYVKQLLNVAVVSQGWEYGTWRAIGRGIEDLALKPHGTRFTSRVRVLLGYVLAMGLMSGVYQQLATHTTPFQTGALNFVTPQSGTPAGNVMLPGEEKEFTRIYSLVVRAGHEPVKWIQGAKDYGWGKAQPIIKDVVSIFTAKDTQDLLTKLQQSNMPIGLQNSGQGLPGWQGMLGIHSAPSELGGVSSKQPKESKIEKGTAPPRGHFQTPPKTSRPKR